MIFLAPVFLKGLVISAGLLALGALLDDLNRKSVTESYEVVLSTVEDIAKKEVAAVERLYRDRSKLKPKARQAVEEIYARYC